MAEPTEPAGVPHGPLRELVRQVFTAAGLTGQDAGAVAEHLVLADLRGVGSHGVSRTAIYVERIGQGLVDPRPRIRVLAETPVSAHLDGGNGPGVVVAGHAMRTAAAKARESGIGAVAVRGSNHCGMLAHYTGEAAAAGLIGFATTSAPASMAPWGGARAYFGTNPLSYAVPVPGGRPDIVFDMATSTVARGKIIMAEKRGERIPAGWALDVDGKPTEDAAAGLAGTMLPLGGAKGSGLALLVDVLSGVLSGAEYGPHIPPLYGNPDRAQNVGHFFLALRPDLFGPAEDFARRMGALAEELAALPTAAGHTRVYLPGEPEAEREAERRARGLPLPAEVRAELAAVARSLGLPEQALACLGADAGTPAGSGEARP
ncbi:Ldh family oxidoreductase [Allonocardiopsis opalescens]|uniref:LDH2 family malate/lactate/ureidoglycolate dehydrogenase n=1 Tax=Allonocardiopsis opalescens TaxID=1144618 RepID=A0A2T0QEU5_9ACTN|nr:Ldh family oxidoreductase [Allonocardiopsis opalescens]PRY02410.1 LDH2 family malate/lactate/ureidoglycolate dehydrogenase [Allonocardiopsis opalescens]